MINNAIFIPGDVPSSKNSKIKAPNGIFHSAAVRKYLRSFNIREFSTHKRTVTAFSRRINTFTLHVGDYFAGVEYPARIGVHFVRQTRRRFDYHNAVQIIFDLLTAHRYIEDDDMLHVIPVIMNNVGGVDAGAPFWTHDKKNAGVWIKILR